MIRPPQSVTRTDNYCPDTTLVRSNLQQRREHRKHDHHQPLQGRNQSVALAQQAHRAAERRAREHPAEPFVVEQIEDQVDPDQLEHLPDQHGEQEGDADERSEEHTSELQSLMRISYAVFCLKKKKKQKNYYSIL